jgi:hypothetical protein
MYGVDVCCVGWKRLEVLLVTIIGLVSSLNAIYIIRMKIHLHGISKIGDISTVDC